MQIVLATDFSAAAAEALRTALLIADAFGAELAVVHADELAHPLALRHMETRVRRLAEAYAPDREVRTIVANGTPVEALLAAADDVAADLLVIGAHVGHGREPHRLGNFAEALLAASPRPVLVARRGMRNVRTIVCGVDCSDDARWAAHSAVEWGERFRAQVSVVNVIEPERPSGHVVGELAAWLPPELRGRCLARELVLSGGAARLVGYANTLKADLIIAGGAQTTNVVRRARCAVLAMLEAPSFAELAVV